MKRARRMNEPRTNAILMTGLFTAPTSQTPLFQSASVWINLPEHPRGRIARVIVRRFVTLARIRTLRAAILAGFKEKMDTVATQHSDHALLAAMKQLADERDAALSTLSRLNTEAFTAARSGTSRPRRKFARGRSSQRRT
jgi:hypothetical protein